MARIRTIKPSAFNSADFCALSPLARCLFFALLCEADREGRLEWSPENLKLRYLPADPKADVDKLGEEMEARKMLVRYEADGKQWASIQNFLKHQRPNAREAASVIPAPSFTDVHVKDRVEGKGREGERKDLSVPSGPHPPDSGGQDRKPGIVGTWNDLAKEIGCPQVSAVSKKRKQKLHVRMNEKAFNWPAILAAAREAKGAHGKSWFTLDFLIENDTNYLKLLEGKYRQEMGSRMGREPQSQPGDDLPELH